MTFATRRTLVPTLLALCAVATPVRAQRADSLPVGARVRVHRRSPPPTVVGILVRADGTSLTLAIPETGTEQVVPRREVARLERHVGRLAEGDAFRRGAQRGAFVGALVGGVATYTALLVERRRPCQDCMINAPMAVGAISVVFLGLSTLVGGAAGAAHPDRWEPVPLP